MALQTIGEASTRLKGKQPTTVELNSGDKVTVYELRHRDLQPLWDILTSGYIFWQQNDTANQSILEVLALQKNAIPGSTSSQTVAESMEGFAANLLVRLREAPDVSARLLASCTDLDQSTVGDLGLSDFLKLMRAMVRLSITENEEIISFFGDIKDAIRAMGQGAE